MQASMSLSKMHATPEGFELSRPLLLPDARTFSDVLEYLGEWPVTPAPEPRHVPEVAPAATDWERSTWRNDGRNEIGPWCAIDLSQLGGRQHRSIAVRATDAVIEAVAPRIVTPDDTLSFDIIGHGDRNRALVILRHGYIIGSHWLAYIDPASIPPYPFEERDKRFEELCDAMRENGKTPFRRELDDHALELTTRDDPSIRAVVYADGSVDLHWSDGSVTH